MQELDDNIKKKITEKITNCYSEEMGDFTSYLSPYSFTKTRKINDKEFENTLPSPTLLDQQGDIIHRDYWKKYKEYGEKLANADKSYIYKNIIESDLINPPNEKIKLSDNITNTILSVCSSLNDEGYYNSNSLFVILPNFCEALKLRKIVNEIKKMDILIEIINSNKNNCIFILASKHHIEPQNNKNIEMIEVNFDKDNNFEIISKIELGCIEKIVKLKIDD